VVLVEQHVNLALGVADQAAVLNHGRIVLSSDAATLHGERERIEQAYFGSPVPP
jgi:branched-chain amino acid transport system ATP-binding protein